MSRQRITEKDLNEAIRTMNLISGNPVEGYHRTLAGEYRSNPGHYHLAQAYGGNAVHQLISVGGSVKTMFGGGYIPKRELHAKICQFIEGYQTAINDAVKPKTEKTNWVD